MKELIFSLIGFIIINVGIKGIKKNLHMQKNGIRTIGTVVKTSSEKSTHTQEDGNNNKRVYRSTVKFTTEDARILEVELGDASGVEDAIGSERKIIYDPEFPQEAKSDNQFNMVIAPWLFLGCGLLLFLWGILELFSVTNVLK